MLNYILKNKIVFLGLVVLILVAGSAALIIFGRNVTPPAVKMTFWGTYEDADVFKPLIKKYQEQFPYNQIKYVEIDYKDYEDRLQEEMLQNRGPSIFMIHNSWLPRYQKRSLLKPMPEKTTPDEEFALRDFQNRFVDVVVDDFVEQGQILAMPLYVDTLALYYNKDILNSAGIANPPSTWQDFLETVIQLTQKTEDEEIIRAGVALGTADNVNQSADILSLLMMQSGAEMVDRQEQKAVFNEMADLDGDGKNEFSPGQQALLFYTSFADPDSSNYTWNDWIDTPYSIDAFYQGKAAMIFDYAYNMETIRKKSPYLNFDIAPMPQHKDAQVKVDYADYWGLAVSSKSMVPDRAWHFINWLTKPENIKDYLALKENRPTACRDLIEQQKQDLDLGVFAQQSLTARSWYQVDNFAIEEIMDNMIKSVVLEGKAISSAINEGVEQITYLMRK